MNHIEGSIEHRIVVLASQALLERREAAAKDVEVKSIEVIETIQMTKKVNVESQKEGKIFVFGLKVFEDQVDSFGAGVTASTVQKLTLRQ